MKLKIRKRFLLILAIFLAIVAVAWNMYFNQAPKVEYTTVKATRGKLIQTVAETGTLKPIDELELNFLSPGKVSQIMVEVGAQVKKDDILAKLDDSDSLIRAKEAEANVLVAQARLNKLIAGASSQDIAVAEANYQAAVDDLVKTKDSQAEALKQAQKTYDDLMGFGNGTKSTYQQTYENRAESLLTTLDNKMIVGVAALDAVLRITDDNDLKNYLSIRNEQYLIDTKNAYTLAKNTLDATASKKPTNSTDLKALNTYYSSMINSLNLVFKDLNYCFNALEYSLISTKLTQAQLDSFKSGIATQSTTISTAVNTLQSAKQSLDDADVALNNAIINAKNALNTAKATSDKLIVTAEARVKTTEAQLKQVSASARIEDIALSRGQLQQAQSSLDLIRNQITNNTIKAPIDGVVSKVNYKVGEQTSSAKPAMVMIAENHYEIEIDISETDIAKVKIDDLVVVTLDAYGDSIKFDGRVIFIEPAETVIQGVTYYKVKIDFTPGDKEIKPGMTATAEIKTASKDDVVMVPARAVIEKDGNKFVRVLYGTEPSDSLVKLGLTGDGGMVEIISGVNEGDEIVTYTKDNSKK